MVLRENEGFLFLGDIAVKGEKVVPCPGKPGRHDRSALNAALPGNCIYRFYPAMKCVPVVGLRLAEDLPISGSFTGKKGTLILQDREPLDLIISAHIALGRGDESGGLEFRSGIFNVKWT